MKHKMVTHAYPNTSDQTGHNVRVYLFSLLVSLDVWVPARRSWRDTGILYPDEFV